MALSREDEVMNSFRTVLILTLGCCFALTRMLSADDAPAPFTIAKQFSADQIVTAATTTATTKVFVDNGKARSEVNANGMQMISIIRPDLQKMYSVMVAQKMVMVMPYDATQSTQRVGMTPEGKIDLVGPDSVDGVTCKKYKITGKDNKVTFIWIDAAKAVPVKMAAEDNSYTLLWKNFKVGPQDASLFEPPTAGYQVMQMPAMPTAPAATPPAPTAPGGTTNDNGQ